MKEIGTTLGDANSHIRFALFFPTRIGTLTLMPVRESFPTLTTVVNLNQRELAYSVSRKKLLVMQPKMVGATS